MCTNWRSLLPYKKNANKKTSWSHARKIAAPTGPMCTNWRSLLPVTMLTITLRRMQTNAGKSETDRLWQNSDKKENKVSALRMQTNAGKSDIDRLLAQSRYSKVSALVHLPDRFATQSTF
jgi:hypothetical protein